MAYNTQLAAKLQRALANLPVIEKKMFGGVAWMLNGNLLVGVHGDNLIARVGPEQYNASLQTIGAKPFDMTGHPMAGWVEIQPAGCSTESEISDWVQKSLAFVSRLPAKR